MITHEHRYARPFALAALAAGSLALASCSSNAPKAAESSITCVSLTAESTLQNSYYFSVTAIGKHAVPKYALLFTGDGAEAQTSFHGTTAHFLLPYTYASGDQTQKYTATATVYGLTDTNEVIAGTPSCTTPITIAPLPAPSQSPSEFQRRPA